MVTTFAEVEARLADMIPGYERREPQERLATAIESALASGSHLLGEAGCGTGKSYGALIPAILTGKRVVYSTATKALQDQIVSKDLPTLESFMAEAFNFKFKWALLKGRSNYFCASRAEGLDPAEAPELGEMLRILNEQPITFSGEKESFETIMGREIPWSTWNKVRSDSEFCGDNRCMKDPALRCCAARARKNSADANIVVVNHAVFAMDLVFSNALLGEYDSVIFDEAHELRSYVRDALGNDFSERSLMGMLGEVRNICRREFTEAEDKMVKLGSRLNAAQLRLFGTFPELPDIKSGGTTARLRPDTFQMHADAWADFVIAASEYAGNLEQVAGHLNGQSTKSLTASQKRLQNLKKRARNFANRVTNLIQADFNTLVRWVEADGFGKDRRFVVKCCPIDVAPFLSDGLFSQTPCVLISATLAVNGKFDFIAKQLGVGEYLSVNVGTPFDYANQCRFYVPEQIPDPSSRLEAFEAASMIHMEQLCTASKGRALILFTSNRAMKAAYDYLSERLPYTCLMQGQGSNRELARQFKEDTHSVLFATRSFMTGVDFQGETCSLVIVNKLPFPVPTEPLFEAESEVIKRRGGSDFAELSIPTMSLVIAQAAGRLIRTKTDQGVFALLDPRVLTKNYGKTIIKTLPVAPLVRTIPEVESFFWKEGE